ncbi:MAG: hypothetical protein Q4G50_02475 [Corynebacterium sp.]|uniref:hypothetical protein n=1 Tax=Corynebacterium sp. TaxID=1720 RepID=UPI0026DFDF05|nr:hypothetical protein [Corynebacterium sp.]MDO5668849.1 hypothetical protein [Corynebacterium sp.]
MIRRRLAVALVAATSTTLALVTPVQAEEGADTSASLSSTSSVSSTDDSNTTGENDLPGWAQSMVIDEETAGYLAIAEAVFAVGAAITQGLVIVLPFIPGGVDQLRATLEQFGIR